MDNVRRSESRAMPILFGILIIAVIAGFLMFGTFSKIDSRTINSVKELYELANPGTTVEVVSITEESGIYKLLLKSAGAGGTSYNEVYVTKDGRLLSQNMIFVGNSTRQIERMRNFVDCLNGKNLRIYGILNQSISSEGAMATYSQLQLLGIYSGKLYVSCDGQNLQSCISLGIKEIPSMIYNSTIYGGAKNAQWLEETTGCKL